jgi:hypothetical protein
MKYNIVVKFNNSGIEVDDDTITVGIKSKPERGRANMELIDKLARHFGVPKTNVKIVSGFTSRKKIVDIIK